MAARYCCSAPLSSDARLDATHKASCRFWTVDTPGNHARHRGWLPLEAKMTAVAEEQAW